MFPKAPSVRQAGQSIHSGRNSATWLSVLDAPLLGDNDIHLRLLGSSIVANEQCLL